MSVQMTEAMKSAKTIQTEMVQWENRVETLKGDCERLTKTREALQEDVAKKSADYALYISQADTQSKQLREAALEERTQLDKDKRDFQAIVVQFQKDQDSFKNQSATVAAQSAKYEDQMNNVRQFIIAVQRACGLIGL